jgi:hypothetical protein
MLMLTAWSTKHICEFSLNALIVMTGVMTNKRVITFFYFSLLVNNL